tara:strand:+ start:3401 stop:3844 length:444 start_codon:yes stop_codon:yes gene_type:complete
MKKLWNKMWSFLLKHNITVCACLILTSIYFSLTILNNVDHAKKHLDLLKDNLTLEAELRETASVLKDQSEFIDFQSEIVGSQRGALEKQEETMLKQNDILRQLINYLKSIDHWPPKPLPPVDRDKWTINDELRWTINNGLKESGETL